jgi:PAS domain S-box-containing protein
MFFQNRNIFNILFEAIPEGVIIVNENQVIIAANSSAEQMFGYKTGALSNKNLNVLIPSKFHLNHQTHFSKFIKSKNIRKINHDLNLVGIKKNKKEFPVEIGLNPFTVNDENFILALIIDITIRKENEKKIDALNSLLEKKIILRTSELNNTIKQLKELNLNYKNEIKKRIEAEKNIKNALKKEQELNELKTKFLSMVSHEFKTPLSGILTSTMLLNKYQLSEEHLKREKHIKTIESKVHYLNNILNDFLSIERLDTSKVTYKFTTFNLSKIINEVVYNANMLLKSGQRIIIPQNSDDFILQQDEKILELILSNLIYNAVKYSPENTTVKLHIIKNGKSIIFNIIDEGIGIPANDQKFIFNRYFRAENVLNTQGTGIGLNIVQAHLENLGGSINFTSKENKGSIFTVKLPLKNEL